MKEAKKFFNFKQFITIIITILATLVVVEAIVMLTSKQESAHKPSTDKRPETVQPEENIEQPSTSEVTDKVVSGPEGKTYISSQKALDVALGAVGVERSAVRDVDVELEYKFGQVYYEVSFENGQYEYEYHIDATKGTVLKSFREVDR